MKIRYSIIIICAVVGIGIINSGFGAWKDELKVNVNIKLARPVKEIPKDGLGLENQSGGTDNSSNITTVLPSGNVSGGDDLNTADGNSSEADSPAPASDIPGSGVSDDAAGDHRETSAPEGISNPSSSEGPDDTAETIEHDDKSEDENVKDAKSDDNTDSENKDDKSDAGQSHEKETEPKGAEGNDSTSAEQ